MQTTESHNTTANVIPSPAQGQDNAVAIFDNPEFGSVRVVTGPDGEPWFVASDVARMLGYVNPAHAVHDHCKKVNKITQQSLEDNGPPITFNIIPQSDVLRLIVRSSLPAAECIEKWIFEDVLPSIIKHGGYLTPQKIEEALLNPDTLIRLATDLKNERAKRTALEEQAERDRPKVVFADSIEVAKTSILVGELAKLIKQSTGFDIGQNRMFEYLRENSYIHKKGSQKNMPTQRSIDAGWMEIKEGTRIGSSGESHITKTTKITGKGQIYFINLFKNMMNVAPTPLM